MERATFITTSWDDGHPRDLDVAELLSKYGLQGTFYVPMTAERGTMTTNQIRELSKAFEIGAHTLNHVVLTCSTDELAWQEISDSKAWIESVTGSPCAMFCPPKGKYARPHLRMIRKAGYVGLRSVELMSLDHPRRREGTFLMPTTIQAHSDNTLTYVKNMMKGSAFRSVLRFITHGHRSDWQTLARSFLLEAINYGGLFHLRGHSWELQSNADWRRLDEVLRFVSEFAEEAHLLTNGQLCCRALSGNAINHERTDSRHLLC